MAAKPGKKSGNNVCDKILKILEKKPGKRYSTQELSELVDLSPKYIAKAIEDLRFNDALRIIRTSGGGDSDEPLQVWLSKLGGKRNRKQLNPAFWPVPGAKK